MTGLTEIKSLIGRVFPSIPRDLREGFQVDAQSENAKRMKVLGGIIALVSLSLVCLDLFKWAEYDGDYSTFFFWSNLIIFGISIIAYGIGYFVFIGMWDIRPMLFSFVMQGISAIMILWAFGISITMPHQGWLFLGLTFVVMALLLFSYTELITISVMVVGIQVLVSQLLPVVNETSGEFLTISLVAYSAACLLSVILYMSRIRNYLNWENINQMNLTLKREVSMHLKTTENLQQIRRELDKKVHDQTSDLREANHLLSEEIAERRYADKVRAILYRISTFVNQNHELATVFDFMHGQLDSVMEVKNLLIAQIVNDEVSIESTYDVREAKYDGQKRDLDSKICSYILKKRTPVLFKKAELRAMLSKNDIEVGQRVPESAIGVPLIVDEDLNGILVTQSFKASKKYDQTDLELLEYVSEHIAIAIARVENERRLISAKDKAEESDRLKSSFLANLSHEIRTPMNAIVGFSELIGGPDLDEEERKYYSTQVVSNSHYLLKLITSIIQLSKVQSGEYELKRVAQNIQNSLFAQNTAYKALKKKLDRSDLYMKFELDESLKDYSFIGDSEGFNQAMFCLVENALKFTHEGGITIGVKQLDRQTVKFFVSDTGIGVEEDELESIFGYFRQGSLAMGNLYRGTGLGLALAKALVEGQGGTISVESQSQKGSCFSFTLKLAHQATTIKMPIAFKEDLAKGSPESNQITAG